MLDIKNKDNSRVEFNMSRCKQCPKKLAKQQETFERCESIFEAVSEVQDFCLHCFKQGLCNHKSTDEEN